MTDSRQERKSALESLEELTKIMDTNVTQFEEEERIMRKKNPKQHKIQDSKRKSQSGHSTSSRNGSDKSHKRSHHHLGSTIVHRKSNEKKPRPKPSPTEGAAMGKNEALSGRAEATRLCGSSSSSSSSARVGRLRYSSGHRYCTVGREGGAHISSFQRRHNNHDSQRSGAMRRSRYPMVSERRGRQISRRRPFVDQHEKSDCNADCANEKSGNLARDQEGDSIHSKDINEDTDYKTDQGDASSRNCEEVCWRLPEHLLDDQSKNLYHLSNDGSHSGFAPDQCGNPWSWRDHDEQLYADYYYNNYNQCYNYYYAYNDCYFYQPQPEAHKPLYHPGHVVYDFIFEDKESVSSDGSDIHMLYRKICQDVSHGNFSSVPGNLGFPYDFSGTQFFPPVLENDVSNNGGNAGIVEESSGRNEPLPFQDPYTFPINKSDSVGNTTEGNFAPVCLPPSEDYGRFKAFLPDVSEYSQRHAISARAKQTHNQKQKSAEGSSSAEDAEFDRAFKRIMMEQFSLFTNFTPEFSEWCLDSCDWDYGKAAWNFIYDPRKVQKIPREAYNV